MPNHVHLIAVPASENSLACAIGEAHRRYTRRINFREGWRGHLWQERFASFPMDLTHLFAATRYVEMNPVAAGLVQHPEDYPWSSARAHLTAADDPLVKGSPLSKMVGNWREFLTLTDEEELNLLKRHERSGRPLGGAAFVHRVETELARILRPQKRGPKPKTG
jgi:putative transposase